MCSGGVGYGWIGYGDQIRKYGKARRGAACPGTARIDPVLSASAQVRRGMEIKLENRECCGLQRLGLVGSGKSWVGLGAVVLGMEIKTIK